MVIDRTVNRENGAGKDRSSDQGPVSTSSHDGFLRQYAETFRFSRGAPVRAQITPTGDAVLFLRSASRDSARDLFVFETKTCQERLLLSAERLLAGSEERLPAAELARRERARQAGRGINDFDLSNDGDRLLISLSGRLFVVDWRGNGPDDGIREIEVEGGFPIDPRFSPNGKYVVHCGDRNLYVIDLETNEGRRLTPAAGANISFGVAEFAAQEEMDRYQGYWFSPDDRFIAFQRNDDSKLPTFYISDPSDPAKEPQAWKYPRTGSHNTDVRLGVLPLQGGDPVWIDWDRHTYPYLATVKWSKNGPLTILVQNRLQTHQILYAVDPSDGSLTELLQESDSKWLNLDQEMPYWLPGKAGFLWTTERNSAWQLELRRPDGEHSRMLTSTDWIYKGLAHVDESQQRLYLSGSDHPLDTEIFALTLHGEPGLQRLSHAPGIHHLKVSADGTLHLASHSPIAGLSTHTVRSSNGRVLGELKSEQETADFPIQTDFETVGEDPRFHAVILRPQDFDSTKKYPVILHVYGGPHVQRVTRPGSPFVLHQWLANQGFIVVTIDGRGTPNRGRNWERAIKGDLIGLPLRDQSQVLEALGQRYPELDLQRVGVFGWSFGGYFSAMAVMQRPDLFKAGVAGAPVCDWRDYDTHYTERYLGLPQEQPESYDSCNVITHAIHLERPLLIIHGTADDNVYLAHGLKMSDALLKAGKAHDFLALCGQTHMVADPLLLERMMQRILAHFQLHLGAPTPL